jgi:L-aminopeptidase/D-esterase-like protein
MAQMAHDGLARTIYPVHTPMDGDTLFTLATGRGPADFDFAVLGALAAEVTARAVVRAVEVAEGLPGYPSIRDLYPC